MRLRFVVPLIAALGLALAAGSGAAPGGGLTDGFVVYKDMGSHAVTEVRDKATGKVVASELESALGGAKSNECTDSRHTFAGARWKAFEPYYLNLGSRPEYLDAAAVGAEITAAHLAWQSPFVTDCVGVDRSSPYQASHERDTPNRASLVGLVRDGQNVVEFRRLAGTMCEGALACTILDVEKGAIIEADIVIEKDLAGAGFPELWTTSDATEYGAGGQIALADVATHEFGHFAGLGHAKNSPGLTMFPAVHDGMQTLGLGDMKGLAARYQ